MAVKALRAKRKRRATKPPGEKLLTRRELAESRGVHPMTVTDWEQRGMPIAVRGSKGRASLYDPAVVEEWHAATIGAPREPGPGDGGPLDSVAARAAKDKWDALLKEQMYRSRERELLPAAEVAAAWQAEVGAVRAKLLGIPQAFSDRVHRAGVLSGVSGVEAALVAAIHDVLRELSGEVVIPSVEIEEETNEQAG